MAEPDDRSEGSEGGGFLSLIIALVAVSVVGAGVAAAGVWFQASGQKAAVAAASECKPEDKQLAEINDTTTSVLALPSIVTNLAGEDAPWLRLDVSVVVPNSISQKDKLAAELSQDILGYVRSLGASELSGGANLYLLKQDLTELARTRTSDTSLDVLIRTFVIE